MMNNGSDDGVFPNSSTNHNTDKKVVTHGFHMQVHIQSQQRNVHPHRKRKRDLNGSPTSGVVAASMSLSSSSSSSSDEDEDTKREATTSQQNQEKTDELKQGEPKDHKPPPLENGGDSAKVFTKGHPHPHSSHSQQNTGSHHQEGWRVKLYRLNADGSWDDCGTGRILCLYKQQHSKTHIDGATSSNATTTTNNDTKNLSGDSWIYQDLGEPTLCMHSEANTTSAGTSAPRILLRTRILLRDAYQRQGDNIITWCEPYLEEGNAAQGVDLALSFQDNAGCLDIWRQITQVQSKAADLFRRNGGDRANNNANHPSNNNNADDNGGAGDSTSGTGSSSNAGGGSSVADVAHAVAAAHHANLQRQQQHEMWVNVASEAAQHHLEHNQNSLVDRSHEHHFEDAVGGMVAAYHDPNNPQAAGNTPQTQLPNPPTLANLEEIADTIAAVQVC
jgi:hypothetical protein